VIVPRAVGKYLCTGLSAGLFQGTQRGSLPKDLFSKVSSPSPPFLLPHFVIEPTCTMLVRVAGNR
jgi:hypothetical protein